MAQISRAVVRLPGNILRQARGAAAEDPTAGPVLAREGKVQGTVECLNLGLALLQFWVGSRSAAKSRSDWSRDLIMAAELRYVVGGNAVLAAFRKGSYNPVRQGAHSRNLA